MAELMASATTQVKALRKGEAIEGVVTKLTPKEILIDIGAKTEAVVLEKDKKLLRSLLSSLKIGDKVTSENTLGEVGLTGRTSGPHTHLEVTSNGNPIDPQALLPEIPDMPKQVLVKK